MKNDFTYNETLDDNLFAIANLDRNCDVLVSKKGSSFEINNTIIQIKSSFLNSKISLDNYDIFLAINKGFLNNHVIDFILIQKCRFYLVELEQAIKDKYKKKKGRHILFNLYLEDLIGFGIAQNYSFDLKSISKVYISSELNSITKSRSTKILVEDKCNSYR